MIKKFKEIFGKTEAILGAYPMVLVMAFLAAVSAMFYINYDYNSREYSFFYVKFGLVAALGISVMYALKMLAQRIGKEILFQLLGILFLVFFYFLLPKTEERFTEVYAYIIFPTFILSHLLVSFIAFIKKNSEISFWHYNKNLFINLFLTVVFTGIFTGGIMLAIVAVDNLFDFNFNGRYYSYTFSFLSIFGSTFIFLLFNEEGLPYLEKNGEYPVILKFFTQYVLVPLLLIYAVILYFYSAKILINWELPRGWVSYLILAYSVVGILAILLVHPLREDFTKSWVKIFSKIFYYTLAPLIVLLFTAIFTRILEYGYTEPRYFVLLLALWLTTVVLYFIFSRKQTIRFVPISLFIFGLFSLIFPYLNAFSVAKRSQKSELLKTLKDNKVLANGTINFDKQISSTAVNDVSDKFAFLAKREENDFLLSLLPMTLRNDYAKDLAEGNIWSFNSIHSEFENVKYDNDHTADYQRMRLKSKTFAADISQYRYLSKIDRSHTSFQFENNTFKVEAPGSILRNNFTVEFNDAEINLLPEIIALFKNTSSIGDKTVDHLELTKKIGPYEVKIIFDAVIRIKAPDQVVEYIIDSESIIVLIK